MHGLRVLTHGVINLFGPLVSLLVGFPISKNVNLSDNGIRGQIYRFASW